MFVFPSIACESVSVSNAGEINTLPGFSAREMPDCVRIFAIIR